MKYYIITEFYLWWVNKPYHSLDVGLLWSVSKGILQEARWATCNRLLAPVRDSEYYSRFPKLISEVGYKPTIIITVLQHFSMHKDTHCFPFKSINVHSFFFFFLKASCSPRSLQNLYIVAMAEGTQITSRVLLSLLNRTPVDCGDSERCTKLGRAESSTSLPVITHKGVMQLLTLTKFSGLWQTGLRTCSRGWPENTGQNQRWIYFNWQRQQLMHNSSRAQLTKMPFGEQQLSLQPRFPAEYLVLSHFLFQPCLACHNQAIKQLVPEVFIAKISIWEGGCIYAIHNIHVLQTACAYSNYTARCKCNPPSSRGRKCPNSNYFCISFSLVSKMLMVLSCFFVDCNYILIIYNSWLWSTPSYLFLLPWKYLLIQYPEGKKFTEYLKL